MPAREQTGRHLGQGFWDHSTHAGVGRSCIARLSHNQGSTLPVKTKRPDLARAERVEAENARHRCESFFRLRNPLPEVANGLDRGAFQEPYQRPPACQSFFFECPSSQVIQFKMPVIDRQHIRRGVDTNPCGYDDASHRASEVLQGWTEPGNAFSSTAALPLLFPGAAGILAGSVKAAC